MIRLPAVQWATLALAAAFAARALLRVFQADFHVLHFAVLGWPPWAVWAISLAELGGAVLLLRPATFFPGAVVLAGVTGAFVAVYVRADAPAAGLDMAWFMIALFILAALRWRGRTHGG
ncbi:hypothetical protein [Wenzhouxiangella sp. XN24]|uniref:hypothetical protein n=1 Tax=Wenzhouxiangella sp. XN24 TaxID=2713569 RepID=UPI0013ED9B6F|nr:hypothetical protein [Wenzhouxiangella sp. XN24]NGX17256.1 hypothetical protein [Wenzhouxiangella sp. XN24]